MKKPSQSQRILWVLGDGAWHDAHELYSFCVAHSRISELRKRGHDIEYRRDGDRHLYRLLRDRPVAELEGPDGPAGRGEAAAPPSLVDDRDLPPTVASPPEQLTLEAAA